MLLTDGVSEPGDFDGLLAKMEANNITLSAVAVGIDADTNLMQYLAQKGHGQLLLHGGRQRPAPDIRAREPHRLALLFDRAPIRAGAHLAHGDLEGLGGLPVLQGYVGTSPRPGGQIALVSDAGDPVLAQWQYGLGQGGGLDLGREGAMGARVGGVDRFRPLLGAGARWTTGTEAGGALQPRVALEGGTARVTVDASSPDGQFLNGLDVSAVAVGPDNITRVRLR